MCYRLYLATPLTLSEVRSMLPAGTAAHAASTGEQRLLRDLLPAAQTIVELRRGPCACDFFIQRDPAGRTDETHLRERGIRAGVPRAELNAMLQRHRQPEQRVQTLDHWQRAFSAFVAEHARNAGPSVYHRNFHPDSGARREPRRERADPAEAAVRATVSRVRERPADWLPEGRPTLVVRD